MDSGDGPLSGCIMFLIFILCNSIFYGFGSAIQHINEGEVERKAETGDKKSKMLLRMLEQPRDLVNTIQVLATLFGILTGFSLVREFAHSFEKFLKNIVWVSQVEDHLLFSIAVILVILLNLIVLLAIGILAPKKICAHYAQISAYQLLPFVWYTIWILRPLTFVITTIANLVVRLFGIDPHHPEDDVTEDEIIDLVDEAHEQGVIQESEAEMIQNIMEFSDKSAKDIMTHRTNLNLLDDGMTLKEAVEFMTQHRNSRYPVFHGDADNIVGFIHIKDAMTCQMKDGMLDMMLFQIPQLIRTIAFIPETRSIDAIFKSMQSKKVHMAVVVDEYGQTAGILTMEDILEEIVGNILDEYDESEDFIQPQFDESILMDGLTRLDDVEDVLGIDFGEQEFETLNGYLTSLLGHIPTEGDHEIHANGYCFQILTVENNIIQKLRVEKIS